MDATPLVRLRGKYPILESTKEANDVARFDKSEQGRLRMAKEPDVVDQEARKRLLAAGRCASPQNMLNYTELQFGQYKGADVSVASGECGGMDGGIPEELPSGERPQHYRPWRQHAPAVRLLHGCPSHCTGCGLQYQS